MKIAFCCTEVVPFAKTGGMADVCGALPLALEEVGNEIIIIMPRYKFINPADEQITKLNNQVYKTQIGDNIDVFFIENSKFFDRDGIYGNKDGDYSDNLERFQFFCRKTLDILKVLNIKVDVIHCHDWATALIPAYLKLEYQDDPFYADMVSVLTVHNLAYQGLFPKEEFPKLELDQKYFNADGFEFHDQINILKGGILFSHKVTTVSEQYANEIQTEKLGCGLDGVLQSRKDEITGILNGLDYDVWNPQTDQFIEKPYTSRSVTNKLKNKEKLQEIFKLPVEPEIPVFGFVGRLDYQKGLELIAETLDEIMNMNVQVVILGVGNEKYHQLLEDMAAKHPEKIACVLRFDEKTAHQIYAGSDIFLMPSRYEPCGLSQMIALRYGTVPLVFKTGGLADTIRSFELKGGNGFVFSHYTTKAFIEVLKKAIKTYGDKEVFAGLRKNAFGFHFDWDDAAKKYEKVYREIAKLN